MRKCLKALLLVGVGGNSNRGLSSYRPSGRRGRNDRQEGARHPPQAAEGGKRLRRNHGCGPSRPSCLGAHFVPPFYYVNSTTGRSRAHSRTTISTVSPCARRTSFASIIQRFEKTPQTHLITKLAQAKTKRRRSMHRGGIIHQSDAVGTKGN